MSCRSKLLSRQRGSTVAGVLVGLLIGVLIAAGVALYINFGPKPFVNKVDQAPRATQSETQAQSAPIALPGKPGDTPVNQAAPADKPKYDFYKILPGGEQASAPVSVKPAEPAAASDRIFLQAGAFQNPLDADNLRARLALMSIESNVQRVDLSEKGVFYRVRVGPFATADGADAMRARLLTEGIESSVVRPKS
jgi:cell division protein FtsN